MKRILSAILALAVMVSMTTVAFAAGGVKPKEGPYSGIADFNGLEVDPGDIIELGTEYFYAKWTVTEKEWDDKRQKDVNVKYTYDTEDYPIGNLYKEYHKVSASWNSGAQYIENVYFEDGDGYVSIEIKGGISSSVAKEISGTIKIQESNVPNREKITYECKIQKGSIIIRGVDEKVPMDGGDKEFYLPADYQDKQVRFRTEDGEYRGTFYGEFDSPKSGQRVADFRVSIFDQPSLYLGFSEAANKTIERNNPNADLRFINWTARPTFDREGTLYLYMDPDEYIYGIKDDSSLYRLGGTYDEKEYAYVIKTKTLGSYVISDTQLSAGSSGNTVGGGSTVTTPSSSAAPSSTAPAPSSTAPAPSSTAPSSTAPPPASTVAPPPASSTAPPPSSAAPSSDPEDEEPSEPEDQEPLDPDDDDEDPYDPEEEDPDDDDDEKKTEKKKFPLIPLLLGVLGIAVVVLAVVVVGNSSRGSRSRSRRRRYDDDWDD